MILRRKKYRFNPETLTYDEISLSQKHRVRFFVMAGMLFGISGMSCGYLLNRFLPSPETLVLQNRASLLDREFNAMLNRALAVESTIQQTLFKNDNTYRTILELDTVSMDSRHAGSGGSAADNIFSLNSTISYQLEKKIDQLTMELDLQSTSYLTLYKKALERSDRLDHMPAIQPVSKEDVYYISSYFGTRWDPFNNNNEQVHSGVDFVAPKYANVYATADGTVTFLHNSRTGYGNEIIITHAFGYSSRYAHLEEFTVSEGDTVKRGQVIGKVGNSGRSTGTHLHYEVRIADRPVNPLYYYDEELSIEDYNEILARGNTVTD